MYANNVQLYLNANEFANTHTLIQNQNEEEEEVEINIIEQLENIFLRAGNNLVCLNVSSN